MRIEGTRPQSRELAADEPSTIKTRVQTTAGVTVRHVRQKQLPMIGVTMLNAAQKKQNAS